MNAMRLIEMYRKTENPSSICIMSHNDIPQLGSAWWILRHGWEIGALRQPTIIEVYDLAVALSIPSVLA
jgi:hypothetical protein